MADRLSDGERSDLEWLVQPETIATIRDRIHILREERDALQTQLTAALGERDAAVNVGRFNYAAAVHLAWHDCKALGVPCDRSPKPVDDEFVAMVADRDAAQQTARDAQAQVVRLWEALEITPDEVGRIMHETWSAGKRKQGFHHPDNCPNGAFVTRNPCNKCHGDLTDWEKLTDAQQDFNRHAFDAVLEEIRSRALLPPTAAQPPQVQG